MVEHAVRMLGEFEEAEAIAARRAAAPKEYAEWYDDLLRKLRANISLGEHMGQVFKGTYRGQPIYESVAMSDAALQAAIDSAAKHAHANDPAIADVARKTYEALVGVQVNRAMLLGVVPDFPEPGT